MPDPPTVYLAANLVLAADHVLLSLVFLRSGWGRPWSSAVARLGWTLAFFFATGVVTHGLNAADAVQITEAVSSAFLVRAGFTTLVVLPLCWPVSKFLKHLRTKEEYARVEAELRSALADGRVARTVAEEATRHARTLARSLARKNTRVAAECDRLRCLLDERVWEHLTVEKLEVMRQDLKNALHGVRNAAAE